MRFAAIADIHGTATPASRLLPYAFAPANDVRLDKPATARNPLRRHACPLFPSSSRKRDLPAGGKEIDAGEHDGWGYSDDLLEMRQSVALSVTLPSTARWTFDDASLA